MSDSFWSAVLGLVALSFISYAIGRLAWSMIREWIETERTSLSKYATVIRTHLQTGNYKVVGGIFDNRSSQTSNKVWEAEELDSELYSRFDSSGRMTISL